MGFSHPPGQVQASLLFLGIMLTLLSLAISGPLPLKYKFDLGAKEQHNIDNANEVHHDKVVEDLNHLAVDVLPDNAEKVAGDEDDDGDVAAKAPVRVDLAGHQEVDTDDDGEIHFDHDMAQKLQKLDLGQLVPADHLDVVKMEQDGHMNKEYHKEMFLGGQHDEFKSDTVDDAEDKLKEVVGRADTNKDLKLSLEEIEAWIHEKITEHFQEAKIENDHIFKHLDPDGDGHIKWKEYYVHFLLSRGFDLDNSLKHVVDYGDSIQLDQDDKNALISYKFRWHDADADPKDNKLTKEEFMAFRHPEHSKKSLDILAKNVLIGVDTNGDGIVTMEEFSSLPPGEVENKEYEEMDRKWQEERKKEFTEIMDQNGDHKVDIVELKVYLDPANPVQAMLESQSLVALMDDDKDGSLSIDEILKHSDIFISSKLVNFAANVHDEF